MARLEFIQEITGVVPTSWQGVRFSEVGNTYALSRTADCLNGLYVTAHNFEIRDLCLQGVTIGYDFVIANTCIYGEGVDTYILNLLREQNPDIQLWYAKQKLEMTENHILRKTNILTEAGSFGFLTSESDRLMFRNRKVGFQRAMELSFDKVFGLYGIS